MHRGHGKLACLGLALGAALTGCGDQRGAANTPVVETPLGLTSAAPQQDRFVVVESDADHGTTLARLLQSIDRRDLTIFAVVDRAAATVGEDRPLPPTTLVIFGYPERAAALIDARPLLAIELPLRALVYERGGQTYVAMTGTGHLARVYGLGVRHPLLQPLERLTLGLMADATGN